MTMRKEAERRKRDALDDGQTKAPAEIVRRQVERKRLDFLRKLD